MKPIDENTVGGRMRKARVSCKLTTRELAEKVGVSQNYLSIVERSPEKQPSPALLQKISEFTGVSLAWLKNGDTVTVEATQFNDIQLLLTLIMQQNPSVTKDTIATVLAVTPETVEQILSGDVEYNPLWESGLSNLIQRINLPAVRKKIRGLDALLQLEEEKQNTTGLFWSLRSFLSRHYKTSFKFVDQPVIVQDQPEYTLFILEREDNLGGEWYIQYYPSPLDKDDPSRIFDQVCARWDNMHTKKLNTKSLYSCVAVAFADRSSYNMAYDFFETNATNFEIGQDLDEARGMPTTSSRLVDRTQFIFINMDSKKVEGMDFFSEMGQYFNSVQ